jgi:hypothetical protein
MTETDEWATGHHRTVDDFRRELMRTAVLFDKKLQPYQAAVLRSMRAEIDGEPAGELPQPIRDADFACTMASGFAYILAAVLAIAQRDFGDEVARSLASEAAELLANGDFENINADVMPDGERPPQGGQQTEECVSVHEHGGDVAPCETLAAMAPDANEVAELEKLRRTCRTLAHIVSTDVHLMFAACIENRLNGPEKAMEWILNGSNDLADQDAGRPWDGKESAQEWFDAVEAEQ